MEQKPPFPARRRDAGVKKLKIIIKIMAQNEFSGWVVFGQK